MKICLERKEKKTPQQTTRNINLRGYLTIGDTLRVTELSPNNTQRDVVDQSDP